MKLQEHYERLFKIAFSKRINVTKEMTIKELAAIFGCTERHTKFLIRKMQEQKWIQWKPQSGRGKRSCLTCLKNAEMLLLEQVQIDFQEGKVNEGLQKLSEANPMVRIEWEHVMRPFLGSQVVTENDVNVDILRYPFYQAIRNLDPAYHLSRHEGHMIDHIFDTLVKKDEMKGEVVPHLAHFWEERDRKIWTFYLRKGIFFHHGREMEAQDIVNTFKRLLTIGEPYVNVFFRDMIQSVQAIDPLRVQFILSEKNELFLEQLTMLRTAIIPLEWVDDRRNFAKKPIGTGPFRLKEHHERMMALEANHDYFQGRPFLDRIEIITLKELCPKRDDTSYIYWSGNEENEQWKRLQKPEMGASYLSFNFNKKGPHNHYLFRKALLYVHDLQAMCHELGNESYCPASGFISNPKGEHGKNVIDMKQAKQALSASPYKGEPFILACTEIRKDANFAREIIWLQKQWKKIGIDVKIKVVPVEELVKPDVLSEIDAVVSGMLITNAPLSSLVHILQGQTFFIDNMVGPQWRQRIKSLVKAIKKEKSPVKQWQYVVEIEKALKNDLRLLFLYHRIYQVSVQCESPLQGVELSSFGRVDYKKLWFQHR